MIVNVNGINYYVCRCAVIENGSRCRAEHGEPVLTREDVEIIASSGFLCEECQKKGYAWLSRLIGDTDPNGQLAEAISKDIPGSRNYEFREDNDDFSVILDSSGKKRATNIKINSEQRDKGNKNEQMFKKYSLVRHCPEYNDSLMLRSEEAKDPYAPVVERTSKTVIGLASSPEPTEKDPFKGKLDVIPRKD